MAGTGLGDFKQTENAIKTLNYTWPIEGGLSACTVTAPFGQKRSSKYDSTGYRWHLGVDLNCNKSGSAIVAAANGTIAYVGGDPDVRNWQKEGRGWLVIINHTDDAASSWYCHMVPENIVAVGQTVTMGTIIGHEGTTGSSTGTHLHFQICTYQGTANKCVYGCSHPLGKSNAFDPMFILSGGRKTSAQYGGYCETGNLPIFIKGADGAVTYNINVTETVSATSMYNLNIGGSRLLSPSNDERKYGVSVYDTVQALIRGTTAAGVQNSGNVFDALDRYSRYLYYAINSAVTVANVQLESMPWIRPGFNVWLDPLLVDRIYYVDSVQHVGSAQGGIFTTLGLSFGRSRKRFQDISHRFGSLRPGDPDNIFLSSMDVRPENFSKNLVGDAATFDAIKAKVEKFYNQDPDSAGFEKAAYHEYLQWFYNTINTECGTVTGAYKAPAIGAASNMVNDVASSSLVTATATITQFDGTFQQGDVVSITGYAYPSSSGKGVAIKYSGKKGTLAVVGTTSVAYPYYVKDIGWVTKSSLSFISRTTMTASIVTKYSSPAATAEYDSIAEIQKMLDAKYAKAPTVIQNRIAKHKKIIAAANKYIAEYYIKEE